MVTIRHLAQSDYAAWNTLYSGYADFYQVNQTQEMRDKVWSWAQSKSRSKWPYCNN
jgi:hypothetical protein